MERVKIERKCRHLMNLFDWEQYQGFAWSWKVEKIGLILVFAHTFTFFFFLILNEFDDKTRNFARVLNLLLPIRISFFLFLNFLPFSNFLDICLTHSLIYSLTHKRAVCAHTFSTTTMSTTNDFFWLLINNNNSDDDILYDLNQSLSIYFSIYVDFSKWASPPSSEWSTRTFYSNTFAVASWHDFQSYKSRSFT